MVTIATNRRIARHKSTIDLIEATESEPFYQGLYSTFTKYRKEPEFRARMLREPSDPSDEAARQRCFEFLNHYELVALGIKEAVIDESFYKEWMAYVVIRDWKAASGLVQLARNPPGTGDVGDKTAYIELEALVRRWDRRMVFIPKVSTPPLPPRPTRFITSRRGRGA